MTLPRITTVWAIRQGVRLAWLMARAAERLGDAGVRLEARLDAIALSQRVDMLDLLEPLTRNLRTAGEA
jgi:hypothetical protein